ncbi:MAG: SOS response-associated peptidase [Cyclobacteriaceae bacterium]|nr:SOS response-associated peptidase [Cyclobacteriaceae bacterium]
MFERYSIGSTANQLADFYSVDVPSYYKPNYNAGPTHLLPVITHHNPEGISFFYWGAIPSWVNNKNVSEKLINVRGETIPDKSTFRKKMMRYRCLVPADGFYAWKKISKRAAIPYRFFAKDKSLLTFAGLWEEFEDEEGETHHTFSIITVQSNGQVVTVNERMPALLDKQGEKVWLNKESSEKELLDALRPKTIELENHTVSPRIASLDANDASLILPSAPADQHGNLTLFD